MLKFSKFIKKSLFFSLIQALAATMALAASSSDASSTLVAEKSQLSHNPVFINTSLSSLFGGLNLGLGVGVNPNTAIGVELWKVDMNIFKVRVSGFEGELNSRWVKSGLSSDSVYIKPFVSYATSHIVYIGDSSDSLSQANTGSNASSQAFVDVDRFAMGALVGYQWMSASGFHTQLGAGPKFVTATATVNEAGEGLIAVPRSGLTFDAELRLGFAI